MSRLDILKKHYEPRIEKYEDTSKVLDWENNKAQYRRFKVLTDNVNLCNKTILDVGCGCGDLFGAIKKIEKNVKYTGVDILEKMIIRAGKEYPDASFYCADIFNENFNAEKDLKSKQFDITFASGIFNLQAGNNEEFLKNAIPVLASLAKETFIFNLLNPNSPDLDTDYFYYPPGDAVSIAEPFSSTIYLLKNYLNNDYTLICRKING